MTRCLKDKTIVPSGGWRAHQPETGTVVRGLSHSGLIAAVAKYRSANGLPVEGNQRRQVENMVCDTLSPDEAERLCKCLDEDDAKNPPEMRQWEGSSGDLENFALAAREVVESAVRGDALHVPQEEAERRAAICAGCVKNVPIANCAGCGTLGRAYRALAGNLKTSRDHELKNCGVCRCILPLLVHFTDDILTRIASKQGHNHSYPEWCWRNSR